MCEQCAAETVTLFEFAPGWVLVRATQQGHTMKPGQLGLVTMNDPSFYLSVEPIPAPRRRNGAIDFGPDRGEMPPGLSSAWNAFWTVVEKIAEDLKSGPMSGYALVRSCMRVGYGKRGKYEPGKHVGRILDGEEKTFRHFEPWLTDRLGRLMVKFNAPSSSGPGPGGVA